MKIANIARLGTAGLILAFAHSAQAATIEYRAESSIGVARASSDTNLGNYTDGAMQSDVDTVVALSYQTTVNNEFEGSTGLAELDVDLEQGVLKYGATATAAAQSDNSGSTAAQAGALAGVGVIETFTASGAGTFTFSIDLDGALSRSPRAGIGTSGNALFEFNLLVQNTTTFDAGTDSVRIDLGSNGTLGSIVDQTLTASVDVEDGEEIYLQIITWASSLSYSRVATSYTSSSDFRSTALLDFSTTSGLTVTASNTGFLAGAGTTMSPVPLPAALPLMLLGLGAIAVTRRKHS